MTNDKLIYSLNRAYMHSLVSRFYRIEKLFCGNWRHKLISMLPSLIEGPILEVGIGTGAMIKLINSCSVIKPDFIAGIDISLSSIQVASSIIRESSYPVYLSQASSELLPFPNNVFKLCFMCFILHHLSDNQIKSTLDEVRRVLLSDGFLLVADYTEQKQVSKLLHNILRPNGNLSRLYQGHLPRIMNENGFTVLKEHKTRFEYGLCSLILATQ